jgi:hypothetical protein
LLMWLLMWLLVRLLVLVVPDGLVAVWRWFVLKVDVRVADGRGWCEVGWRLLVGRLVMWLGWIDVTTRGRHVGVKLLSLLDLRQPLNSNRMPLRRPLRVPNMRLLVLELLGVEVLLLDGLREGVDDALLGEGRLSRRHWLLRLVGPMGPFVGPSRQRSRQQARQPRP